MKLTFILESEEGDIIERELKLNEEYDVNVMVAIVNDMVETINKLKTF